MDNKSTTKRMIGAVVLVLVAALLLAWLLKGKNDVRKEGANITSQAQDSGPIQGFPNVNNAANTTADDMAKPNLIGGTVDNAQQQAQSALSGAADATVDAGKATAAAGSEVMGNVADSAGNAVDAGKQALQDAASGFSVRPTEQRQVVDKGDVKPGVGSMGTGATVATNANTSSGSAANATAASGTAASGAASAQDKADTKKTDVSSEKKVPQAKLVGEKTVPSPTAEAKRRAAAEKAKAEAAAKQKAEAESQQAAGGSGYVVQVLASGSQNKADALRNDLAKDGYAVFVAKAVVNGKTVYRVRVGTYPTKEAAVAVQTRMKARYTKNPFVKNSFVTRN